MEKWNFSLVFPDLTPDLYKKELLTAKTICLEFISKWEPRTDYLSDPKVLKEALDEFDALEGGSGTTGRLGTYYFLKRSLDQENPELKAEASQVENQGIELGNKLEFFMHRISKIPEADQSKFLENVNLKEYKHLLERMFLESKYLLTEPEEKILNLISKTSYENWVDMVSDFISREERDVLTEEGQVERHNFSEIMEMLISQKKEVRDSAFTALNEIFEKHTPVAEYEINSVLYDKKVNDELRGFTRPDQSRHLSDDFDSSVVDALIGAVTSRFDISQRYYKLKAGLTGVEKLQYQDRNFQYSLSFGGYPFAEAVDIVSKVFKKLHPDFYAIFDKYLSEGSVDVFPKKGKDSGAFCAYLKKSVPGFILLNHAGKLNDVTTLAHEFGHAINHELIRQNQKELNSENSTGVAEVASTFMEDFVFDEIQNQADDETRLAIMMERLNSAVSSIQRQVACYNFELELHSTFRKKGYLSKKEIGEIFSKNMSSYMGDFVEMTPGSENWWVYWSHIRSYFYVYSYASGSLISKSLKSFVLKDHSFVEKVKNFLSLGSSVSPKDAFKTVGIDIADKNFWETGLAELDLLLSEAELLAKKLKKI